MRVEPAKQSPRRLPVRGRGALISLSLIVVLACLVSSYVTYWGATEVFTSETKDKIWKWAADRGLTAMHREQSFSSSLARMPGQLPELLGAADIPRISIDISFKNWKKLQAKRAQALDRGLLIQEEDDFVPAKMRHDNRTTKVKLRLKGDMLDHLEGYKISYRIHVRGDDQVFGMRRFSLQHPKTRGFHAEILFFETLRELGVLAPQYRFVDVTENGAALGIMALEEHFSKELLEANGRRESVIIRFDESLYWAEQRDTGKAGGQRVFAYPQNSPIDAFESGRIRKSEKLQGDYRLALGLLRSFVEGKLLASETFDVELTGRFLAAARFWGSWHSLRWHNMRFYFNPVTARLEPIGFDATLQSRIAPGEPFFRGLDLARSMLQDTAIFAAYSDALQYLADAIEHGDLNKRLAAIERDQLKILKKEFYFLEALPAGELENRAAFARGVAETDRVLLVESADMAKKQRAIPDYPTLLHANLIRSEPQPYLEIASAVPHDIQVLSLSWVGSDQTFKAPFVVHDKLELPLNLTATPRGSLPQIFRVHYEVPASPDQWTLQIEARVKGRDRTESIMATPYHRALLHRPIPESNLEEQLSKHDYLSLGSDASTLRIEPGQWQVHETLVVPPGYSLNVNEGTTLQFAPDSALIAHGPLHFKGAQGDEIVLEGLAPPDGDGSWRGIAVLEAGARSEWSYVTILDTTGVRHGAWQLTGGVTFYKSDITIKNSRFEGNRGEDALNIFASSFELLGVTIADTVSDAFDADFADGAVIGGVFRNIGSAGGGDAIDVSGSTVEVSDTQFVDVSDKALSTGEKSEMRAVKILVQRAGTAAASKDGSRLTIADVEIRSALNAGLMAYIKKPEYGAASIEANNITFIDTEQPARAQKGSRIVIDGQLVDTEDLDVEQLYDTVMRPGLRR